MKLKFYETLDEQCSLNIVLYVINKTVCSLKQNSKLKIVVCVQNGLNKKSSKFRTSSKSNCSIRKMEAFLIRRASTCGRLFCS